MRNPIREPFNILQHQLKSTGGPSGESISQNVEGPTNPSQSAEEGGGGVHSLPALQPETFALKEQSRTAIQNRITTLAHLHPLHHGAVFHISPMKQL